MAQSFTSMMQRFARVGLAQVDTPLEPMQRLSDVLGGPRLWVKLEDMTSDGVGGNKLRKLDYVLHQALADGADTLVAAGVVQSNTLTQVAAAATALGMDCHLATFHGSVPSPTPNYDSTGNARLNRLLGAHIHNVYWDGDRKRACDALRASLTDRGKRPFAVPYGVSNAIGAVAYVAGMAEIAQQAQAIGITPAAVVHGSGSGATQAGLTAGAAIVMPHTKVIGVAFDADLHRVRTDTATHLKDLSTLLEIEPAAADIEVVPWRSQPHYGLPHQATIDAIELAHKHEQLELDAAYSGKALAGLIAQIKSGRWDKDTDIVFVHTGGMLSSHVTGLEGVDFAA